MDITRISTETVMTITGITIGFLLVILTLLLLRRDLFHWKSSGFWAIVAFALYFCLAPLSIALLGSNLDYDVRLALAGGSVRGLWILLVALLGIASFFFVYLRTSPAKNFFGLSTQGYWFTPVMALVFGVFLVFGFYSLITFRAGLISSGGEVVIDAGRFVGGVTGYQSLGYMFLFSPTLLLLLLPNRIARTLGWILAGLFILFSLPHAWSRAATVSMALGVVIAKTVVDRKRWPSTYLIGLIVLFAAVLQVRGHTRWTLGSSGSEISAIITQLPVNADRIFTQADTAMLITWYLESYVKDEITGYDYGIPLINYILTGWIPGRFFPDKYFMVDWLREYQGNAYSPGIDTLLYGAKSSLLGGFYSNGGVIAVIIEMAMLGFLFRKLDGMLDREAPLLIQALGVTWMCIMWMVWGSSDYWGLMALGVQSIPIVVFSMINALSKPKITIASAPFASTFSPDL